MGVLNCLEPHHRLAAPDTPPELVSPTLSSYSSRVSPSAEHAWKPAAPISPPMSSYDRSSVSTMASTGKGSEDGQARKDGSQSHSRTQLPSLSSLFPLPHYSTTRPPLHSPALSDRHGSLPAPSPLEQPSRAASSHSDRPPFPSPFFGGGSPHHAAQPRTPYDSRYDSDRHSFHSVHGSLSRAGTPPSDRLRNEPPRFDGAVGSRWSRAHEQDYILRGRETPLTQPSHARPPVAFSGPQGPAPGYHSDPRSSRLSASSSMSLPTTPAMAEGLPTKDGLGPKIWTGTHFLPRFVCAAEVPGEGMCYFYDDGSHCKTVIDGEPVNAHWGVTKAGKPRKRLAIACVTCREKKIKCDPDFPRCIQCEKFGRVCKFKNAPRGGHNTSPTTPELEDARRLSGPPSYNEPPRSARQSSPSLSPRTVLRPAAPEESGSHKRIRIGYEGYSPVPSEPLPAPQPAGAHKPSMGWQPRSIELPRIHESVIDRPWRPQS